MSLALRMNRLPSELEHAQMVEVIELLAMASEPAEPVDVEQALLKGFSKPDAKR